MKKERKSLEKASIFIYPVPKNDSEAEKSRKYRLISKEKSESLANLHKYDPQKFENSDERFKKTKDFYIRNGPKKWTYPLQSPKLSNLKVVKALTPKLQKKWIDLFIDTIECIQPDKDLLKSLRKSEEKLKDNLEELNTVKSFTIRRPKMFKKLND